MRLIFLRRLSMKFLRYPVFFVLLFPVLCSAQNRWEKEMMREIALLAEQVKTLQASVDGRVTKLEVLTQQTFDAAFKANTAVAGIESMVRDRLTQQEKQMGAPLGALGAKVDQMAGEFQGVKESVTDLNARMTKLQNQINEIASAIKTLTTPLPPPAATP